MKNLSRMFLAAVAVAAWVSSASAASLSILGGGISVPIGATVTLTLQADGTGAPAQSFANAAIKFGGPGSTTAIEPSFIGAVGVDWNFTGVLAPGVTPATSGTCSVAANGNCTNTPGLQDGMHRVIDLADVTFGMFPFNISPGSVLGAVQFVMGGPGVYTFTGVPDDTGWFGVVSGGSANVTVIPEPTTAGLLALGLGGLAMAGRRRRQ